MVSSEVLAAVGVVALAVVPLLFGLPHDRVSDGVLLPLLVWPALGLAGTVVLDRRPGSPLGRACVLAAPLPCLAISAAAAVTGPDGAATTERFAGAAQALGPLALAPLLVAGASPLERPGPGRATSRHVRRWWSWTALTGGGTVVAATTAWWAGWTTAYGVLAAVGVGTLAAAGVMAVLGRPPRPLVEPVLDASLLALVAAVTTGAGLAVLAFARAEQILAPEVLAALAAAATAALAVPTALSVRRELTRRRYGSGSLTPHELTGLSRGLRPGADPRDLLARAAAGAAGLSGVRAARLVLDPDDEPGWTSFPLRVDDDTVGVLLVVPTDPEGLEERQRATLLQLLPTLALAVRAVALAVDAEHARSDAVRQREDERARVLADLHDDLGPVLAGIGMRVEALRSQHALPGLDPLAADIGACRGALRRIVADLAPAALDAQDLPRALEQVARSFGPGDRPRIRVAHPAPADLDAATAVAVYRIAAEGITNAVRHGRPTEVEVVVRRAADGVEVEVRDDGCGGRIDPGVGLGSLRRRAEQLGGTLRTTSTPGAGTVLRARLPEATR